MKLRFTYVIISLMLDLGLLIPPICAQENLSSHSLLKRIETLQASNDPFFIPGVFPSYVSNKNEYKELRKDNNVYYTAIISYTLQSIRPLLDSTDRVIVDSIEARSERSLSRFKNTHGRETYNFWRTDSAYRLPYLWGVRVNKKNLLDDDVDCTSMCLLSSGAPASIAQKAHVVMQEFTNDVHNPTNTTFSRYRSYGAYSTWLGEKLPIVFDICVLSNILTFVQTYDLAWSAADSASLELIIAVLKHKDHIRNPSIVAPYYANTSLILYHVARLMNIKPIPALDVLKQELISDALVQLQNTSNEFEKMILGNALLKWKYSIPPVAINASDIEKNDLPFFVGNIPSIFSFILKKPLSRKKIGFYYHYCPAYNDVLLLEHLVLKNKNEAEVASIQSF